MRLLLWILILGFIFWYFSKKRGVEKRQENRDKREALVTELVLDENCGSYIKKDEAIKLEIDGKTYYFCSKRCLEEFLKKKEEVR